MASAKAVLLTLLGELVLPAGGMVWTGTVVAGLGEMGIDERNARQALARLRDQGLVDGERAGRRTRWALTDAGRRLLVEGSTRIYGFGEPAADWDDHWLVVLSTIPEELRAQRQQLRARLAFAGFGFLGPGTAITPHLDREPLATAAIEELDLRPHTVVLRAEAGTLVPAREMLCRAWDLDELADRYQGFTDDFGARQPRSPSESFSALVGMVDEWRRFPAVDPEIPDRLLPPDWPGREAKRTFDSRRAAWSGPAAEWFRNQEEAITPGSEARE